MLCTLLDLVPLYEPFIADRAINTGGRSFDIEIAKYKGTRVCTLNRKRSCGRAPARELQANGSFHHHQPTHWWDPHCTHSTSPVQLATVQVVLRTTNQYVYARFLPNSRFDNSRARSFVQGRPLHSSTTPPSVRLARRSAQQDHPRPRRQVMSSDQEREHALQALRSKLIESREWEAKLKALRLDIKGLQRDYDQTEENIKALQSVGQIIGEVLKQLDEERCTILPTTHGRLAAGPRPRPLSKILHTDVSITSQSSLRPPPGLAMSSVAGPRLTRRSSSRAHVSHST